VTTEAAPLPARPAPLLKNLAFVRLLAARLFTQTAQNMLTYALLILVVEKTESSFHSTLLVVSFTLPSILFGIPAGVVSDALPKRFTLIAGTVLRAATAGALVYYDSSVWWIYLFAAALSTIGQFYGPAENASIPRLVAHSQLARANSYLNLVLLAGQVIGMITLAPLLLKIIGGDAVFVVAAGLFGASVWFFLRFKIPRHGLSGAVDQQQHEEHRRQAERRGPWDRLSYGWRILREDDRIFAVLVVFTLVLTLSRILVVLIPHYVSDVLGLSTENTVYVAAPAAIGSVVGLLLAPLLVKLIGAARTAALGFVLFVLALTAIGLVTVMDDFIEANFRLDLSRFDELVGISPLASTTMIIAIPGGLAFALAQVAGRTFLIQHAPDHAQGQVFATQMAIADIASLVPLFAVGAIADLIGVRVVLVTCSSLSLVIAAYVWLRRRRQSRSAQLAAAQPA
jgi:MFS family permease